MNPYPVLLVVLFGAEAVSPIDFDTDVIAVLTKAGCNTGACHGAAIGRGGFALSLYGSDPAADYETIVRKLEGRRINLARPEESLLLTKATEVLTHGGGTRLEYEEEGANLLQNWVQEGASRLRTRHLERLEVDPRSRVVEKLKASVDLRTTAHFADGSSSDVTRWTVFTAADPAAVEIDPETAKATISRRGKNIVIARFLDRVLALELIVPLRDAPIDLSGQPRHNFIDEEVLETLSVLRLPVSGPVDDPTFLRRLRLDLTGTLPSPEEVRKFLADKSPDKRARLVDRLLASEEFVDYWTYKFANLLRIRSQPNDTQGARAFHGWLRQRIEQGSGYDEIARMLLEAEGDSHEYGPANFYRVVGNARSQAEFVSELFMGARLRCANCHNHPLDQWTQDDYHGLAALFAKIERGRHVRLGTRGEVTHPRTGNPAVPRIPGEQFLDPQLDGRKELADWLTSPENRYFGRAVVNRLWKELMGRGLIEPTDDHRATNPATHPRLLEKLAADFVASGYDLRHTLRLIANSATYARSWRTNEANEGDDRFYSHALVRPLEPEVLADALDSVAGVSERYGSEPLGTRAVALFDPKISSTSLDILGRCSREETCEGSVGVAAGGLSTRLHLINGPLINRKITAPEGRLARRIEEGRTDKEILEEFYLRALGRMPRNQEQAYWSRQFASASGKAGRRQLAEDMLWSLLNSREFVTNH